MVRQQKWLRHSLPRGWFHQNKLFASRLYQENIFPLIDPREQRAYPNRARTNSEILEVVPVRPNNFFVRLIGLLVVPAKFARAQTDLNLAKVACALERYRRANGQYPESLQTLAPRFIDTLPLDLINGQPLNYRRTDDGQFVLYSVGWDRKDDGGRFAVSKPSPTGSYRVKIGDEPEEGDWVWRYPAKE